MEEELAEQSNLEVDWEVPEVTRLGYTKMENSGSIAILSNKSVSMLDDPKALLAVTVDAQKKMKNELEKVQEGEAEESKPSYTPLRTSWTPSSRVTRR